MTTTLTTFKQAGQRQLSLDQLLTVIEAEETGAIVEDPGQERKPKAQRLTKRDGIDPTIVPLFPGEHRPARRW